MTVTGVFNSCEIVAKKALCCSRRRSSRLRASKSRRARISIDRASSPISSRWALFILASYSPPASLPAKRCTAVIGCVNIREKSAPSSTVSTKASAPLTSRISELETCAKPSSRSVLSSSTTPSTWLLAFMIGMPVVRCVSPSIFAERNGVLPIKPSAIVCSM